MKRWVTPEWHPEGTPDSQPAHDGPSISCATCDICRFICPDLAVTRSAEDKICFDLDYCKGCGLCAHYCPENRIQMVKEK